MLSKVFPRAGSAPCWTLRWRFEADTALRAELAAALGKLSARKKIERAKGILMRSRGLDEESAYNELRRIAMDRGATLIRVAQEIIEAKALLS